MTTSADHPSPGDSPDDERRPGTPRRTLPGTPPAPPAAADSIDTVAPVDIVIPIYGAAAELERCLSSVGATTDLTRHRLLLVLDGPQPEPVEPVIDAFLEACPGPARAGVEVLAPPERGGFVVSVNRGMARSRRDVILLNSDTEVTEGWVDKLARAVASAPDVASATPFSNNATICSLPRFLEENALPTGHDVASFGRLVERVSNRVYPELPTGVGVCLYLRRACLDEVGLFDEDRFGLGYGEESEWCMRARRAGWRHVLDDSTFVFHAGQSSFGSRRARRVDAAHRVMRRLHPEYLDEVADFIERDPLEPLRRRVASRLFDQWRVEAPGGDARGARPGPRRVVHVVHGFPPWNHAGTELYARWLARDQARHREVFVFGRLGDPRRTAGQAVERLDHGIRVRLLVNNFDQRNPLVRNGIHDRFSARDFDRFLADTEPDLVHVHHLAGHAANLTVPARSRGIPILYQIQDWWTPCVRVNLLHRRGHLCSGPGIGKCSRCFPLTGLAPAALTNRILHGLRRLAFARALRRADGWVMGSHFIERTYRELGLLRPRDPAWVVPYGVPLADDPDPRPEPRAPTPPVRFAFIGSMMSHKGAHVAVDAFREIPPGRATLDLWGDPGADPAYTRRLEDAASPSVRFRGRFPEQEKAALLDEVDVLVVPSLGLESFGLVAREAMSRGVPVLVSHRGALIELVAGPEGLDAETDGLETSWGASFPPGDPRALQAWIERLLDEPERITRWSRHLPPVVGTRAHAERIETVYRELLG